jgi:nitroreductase
MIYRVNKILCYVFDVVKKEIQLICVSFKMSNEDLETIKEAIRLVSSSYGLEPYTVFIIVNPELRAKLQPA